MRRASPRRGTRPAIRIRVRSAASCGSASPIARVDHLIDIELAAVRHRADRRRSGRRRTGRRRARPSSVVRVDDAIQVISSFVVVGQLVPARSAAGARGSGPRRAAPAGRARRARTQRLRIRSSSRSCAAASRSRSSTPRSASSLRLRSVRSRVTLAKPRRAAVGAAQRGDHDVGPEAGAVLADPPSLALHVPVLERARGASARARPLARSSLGVEGREVAADDLVGAVALEPLGAEVPAGDTCRRGRAGRSRSRPRC